MWPLNFGAPGSVSVGDRKSQLTMETRLELTGRTRGFCAETGFPPGKSGVQTFIVGRKPIVDTLVYLPVPGLSIEAILSGLWRKPRRMQIGGDPTTLTGPTTHWSPLQNVPDSTFLSKAQDDPVLADAFCRARPAGRVRPTGRRRRRISKEVGGGESSDGRVNSGAGRTKIPGWTWRRAEHNLISNI